ncbi:helix-turn-helix domain-containing protein [Planctomicrobium piriforme]|uniref:DNA binding domain-containing protein, excisionase family n=1 Tax=Planctomicrobium piriforme TaxID=1576369 RepID=A0A1I3Q058_9PLAN|nr:helix-turn-helix domain-containing protein [Planctomicrobium piriforme]SFJ26841.1 DNA binding domain-containing protein, excisionase family [Planctomicrobium piriforme]
MKTLSLSEVAERLDVSVRTVEVWISTGELRALNASRNPNSRKPRLRVRPVDLETFEAGREIQTAQKRTRRVSVPREIPRYV